MGTPIAVQFLQKRGWDGRQTEATARVRSDGVRWLSLMLGLIDPQSTFALTLLTVSITMTCKTVNLSFTLFMTLKDNVRGGKMGVLRLNVPHMLAHGTCGITYLVYTPSCLHQTLVSHLVSHSNCCTNAWTCTEYCRMGDTHLPEGYQMRLVVKSLPKSWQSMSIWGLVMWCTFCRSPFYSHKRRVIAHCVSLPLNMLAGVDSQSLLFPQDFQVSFFLYVLLMLSRYLIGFSRWLPQFVSHNFDARYAILYGQDWWIFVNLKSCLFLFC